VKFVQGDAWKEGLARLVRRRLFIQMMGWAIRLTIPRQRIGVALVAFNDQEEVFLLRHVFHPTTPWGLPGGWLRRNEAPQAGLVRELREETGLKVTLGPVVHVVHEHYPNHVVLAYLGWIEPGPIRLNYEVLEARWHPLSKLPHSLQPFTRQAITIALEHFRTLPGPWMEPASTRALRQREDLPII
jgi:ADP-ribose pyrophosphatase YjhB (NUDIX family)